VARCLDTQTHTVFFGDAVYSCDTRRRFGRLMALSHMPHGERESITFSCETRTPLNYVQACYYDVIVLG
jgi:hypothetical protein